ncbi:hypothetical protein ACQUJT_18200 [Ralstonia pseudosolanacearum]
MKMRTLSQGLAAVGLYLALGAANAASPMMRVGTSSVCPSELNPAGVAQAEALPIVAALAAGVVANLAGSLIDDINTYLTATPSTTIADVYPIDALLTYDTTKRVTTFAEGTQCVWVVVSNELGDPYYDNTGVKVLKDTPKLDEAVLKSLVPFDVQKRQLFVDATGVRKTPVLFYFEAKVKSLDDGSAWRLAPWTVYYPKFFESSNVFQSSQHDFALTIQYSEPGKESSPFATYMLKRDAMEESSLDTASIRQTRLAWMPPPKVAAPSKEGTFFPTNITASLVETRKPNELAKALSKSATDQKSAVTSLVNDKVTYALSQDTRLASYAKNATAAKTALDAYNKAYADAKTAQAKYEAAKKAGDTSAAKLALNDAQVAYYLLAQAESAARSALGDAQLPFTPGDKLPDLT